MALIELVDREGFPTGLTIDSARRYSEGEIQRSIRQEDLSAVNELANKLKAETIDELVANHLFMPHAHFILYTTNPYEIGCQKRPEQNKKPFRGMTLPLTAGGHVNQDDFSRFPKGGRDINLLIESYATAAWREAKEELRNETKRKEMPGNPKHFTMKESDLTRIESVAGTHDFSSYGLPIPVYLEVFAAEYDSEEHGIIIPSNGTEEIQWYSPNEVRRIGIHKPLGEAGEKILEYFENLRMKD